MSDFLLKLENLSFSYGQDPTLENLSLRLERGKNRVFIRTKRMWKD